MPEDAPSRSGGRTIQRITHGRFERVSFRYHPGQASCLSEVSFEIPKGSVVALVGPSGAGKSTIVGLLYRFFDPSHGRILVDGVTLPQIELASWLQRLAFAGQDVELMTGTVRENLCYGNLTASDADLGAAARLANADEFISALPGGYHAMVGARGLSLSAANGSA